MKKFYVFCLISLSFRCLAAYSQTIPSSKALYESLVKNVENCEGRFILYLNSGEWSTILDKKKFLINTDKSLSPKVSVTFKYAQGKLQFAKLDFQPAIHAIFVDKKCASLGISSLTYDSDGDVVDQKSKWDNSACKDPNVQKIFRLFEFATEFDKLALGIPFPALVKIRNSDEKKIGKKSLVYRVKFLPNDNENKALHVILKEGATIYFQRGTTQTNFLRLRSPSFFNFKKIDYNLNTEELEGELEKFEVYTERGELANDNCYLNIGTNSEIKLGSIRFKKTNDDSYVEAESGLIKCSLTKNTFLVLYNQPRPNKILFDDGSSAELIGFRMNFYDNLKTSDIQFVNGSIFKIKVAEGILSLGDKGYLKISNSEISANLGCIFPSKGKPNVSGIINSFDVSISSGELIPDEESRLMLGSGTVKANSLVLNSMQKPFITGAFEKFNVKILENSVFNIPNGFNSVTDSGGSIDMNNPTSPLTIDIGSDYPYGELEIAFPFKSFDNGLTKQFVLKDGMIDGKIEHKSNGAIIGKDLNIKGNLFMALPSEIGGSVVQVVASINDGKLIKNFNQKPTFSGDFSCIIPSKNTIKYTSPRLTPDNRTIVFPTTLDVSFTEDIVVNKEAISFNGSIVEANFSKKIAINAYVPKGCGEHDIDNNDQCPSDEGPDDRKTWQEVVRHDVKFGGVAHIYLAPDRNYVVDMTFDLIFDANGFDVQVSNMHPRQAVEWDRDGGEGIVLGIISVIGGAFLGPTAIIPIFVGSNVVVDSVADKYINTMIYTMFTKFKPRIKK